MKMKDRSRNIATGDDVNGDRYGKSKIFKEIFFLPELDLCIPDVRFVRPSAFGIMGSINNMQENDLFKAGNLGKAQDDLFCIFRKICGNQYFS
jgi:hypothetical protein